MGPRSPSSPAGLGFADTVAFLARVRLFEEFDERERTALARLLLQRPLARGEVLFMEGDPGEEMFLVRHGMILISKRVMGSVDQVIARLGPGEFFGEMTLFDRGARSATAEAESTALLLALSRDSFARLIDDSSSVVLPFMRALLDVFVERLRASNDLVAEVARWGFGALTSGAVTSDGQAAPDRDSSRPETDRTERPAP